MIAYSELEKDLKEMMINYLGYCLSICVFLSYHSSICLIESDILAFL
jgi:hypothetical protein